MVDLDEFLQEIRSINWFGHCKETGDKYCVIHSIFEAYDNWNERMLKTWEPNISALENDAVKQIGDEKIDIIFSTVSAEMEGVIGEKWCEFIVHQNLEEEIGLESEMLDMVKRDVSWACVEKVLHKQGFFSVLLEIYKDGYFPCAWTESFPNGKAVVL